MPLCTPHNTSVLGGAAVRCTGQREAGRWKHQPAFFTPRPLGLLCQSLMYVSTYLVTKVGVFHHFLAPKSSTMASLAI